MDVNSESLMAPTFTSTITSSDLFFMASTTSATRAQRTRSSFAIGGGAG